jgi:hypothetical protein
MGTAGATRLWCGVMLLAFAGCAGVVSPAQNSASRSSSWVPQLRGERSATAGAGVSACRGGFSEADNAAAEEKAAVNMLRSCTTSPGQKSATMEWLEAEGDGMAPVTQEFKDIVDECVPPLTIPIIR